jgi:putative proteasome-type protease
MTFCLGIAVEDGLVGIADTRLLSGHECLVAKKVATYRGPGFSFFVMTSGLRSLRDKVLLHFEEAFAKSTLAGALNDSRDRLSKVVNLYAQQVRRVAKEDGPSMEGAELSFNLFTLIGGQMPSDNTHKLFLVYPEGNWVEVGPDTPYQIIGASGYGKPILERSLQRADSMEFAFKVGILAFDATRLCAVDVDYPMDVVLIQKDSFDVIEHRYERDDLRQISNWWQERMRHSVQDLPEEWIDSAFSKLTHNGKVHQLPRKGDGAA